MVFSAAPVSELSRLSDFFDGFGISAHAVSEDDLIFRLVNGGTEYEISGCDETAAGELIIPSVYNGKSVTSIGDYAFLDCRGLSSVTIPDSVRSIGFYAFGGCTGLRSLTIGNGVTSMGEDAFFRCTGLRSLTIGASVASIREYTFSDCTSLSTVTITNGATSIGFCAFGGCTGLSSVTIPDSVRSIGTHAFSGCTGLSSITFPDSVRSIGFYAFSGCTGLRSITFPDSVTSVGNCAFEGTAWYNNQPDGVVYIGKVAYKYKGTMPDGTAIDLRNGTKNISDAAFSGCTGLSSITIPDSVTCIGYEAFSGCTGLSDITVNYANAFYSIQDGVLFNKDKTHLILYPAGSSRTNYSIPDSVTSIGDYAFSGCTGLSTVTIGNSVTNIGNYAFSGCTGLSTVTIGNSVTSIGEYAFRDCTSLSSITIPDSVTSIGNYAFSGCTGLSSVTIGNSVTRIGEYAFRDCTGLNTVYFNAENCAISFNGIFSGCDMLSAVVIGEGVTIITNYAFRNCTGLSSVTIPDSVTSIGYEAFYKCSLLSNVYYGGIESDRSKISIGYSNEYLLNAAWYYNLPVTGVSLDITSKSLAVGGTYRFIVTTEPSNSSRRNVTWTSSDTDIATVDENGIVTAKAIGTATITVTTVDGGKTASCTVTVNDVTSILTFKLINGDTAYELSACDITAKGTLIIPATYNGKPVTGIGSNTFYNCYGLSSVTIPDSVTSIGSYAFYNCYGLSSVTIGNSVTSIGSNAFYYCYRLSSVTIPDSVTSVGGSAFYNTAWYNNQPNGLVYIGKVAYKYKGTMPAGTAIVIRDGTKSIGYDAFYGCTGLSSVTIGNSVTSIGNYAFSGCTGLSTVTIPDSVTSIGERVFSGCTGLSSVTIPDSVTSIGSSSFYGCTGLSSVTIGNSVTSIGSSSFYGCTGLSSVTIGNSVTSIGDYAFSGCTGLSTVTIPDSVTSIGERVFSGCTGLSSVTIPDSVTSIGSSSFYGCKGLSSVTIPDSVTRIGSSAFSGCIRLSNVFYGGSESDRSKISISSSDNQYLLNATWYYNLPVTGVLLDITDKILAVGETQPLTATIAPANTSNRNVTWTSSDTDIATVDENGIVTAQAAGTATITVTTVDGNQTATCEVTVVTVPVTDVTLDITDKTLAVGGTQRLTAIVAPENATNKTVTWESSDTAIATVDENGIVTAQTAGTATITATTVDGNQTATCEVTVITVSVTDVTLDITDKTLVVGGTQQLTAIVAPENATNKTVTWESSDTSIATVDENGIVTAQAAGTATITVTTVDGNKTATCEVTVIAVELSTIAVKTNPTKVSYFVGDTLDTTGLTLTATYNNGTAETITSGFVCSPTALNTAGTKTITVTYGGKSCSLNVTVEDRPPVVNPDAPQFIASNSTAKTGKSVNVTISIENNPGIVATRLFITYDPEILTLSSVSDGGLLGTGTFVAGNDTTAIPYSVMWEDCLSSTDYSANGTLLTLTFSVNENAVVGTTPITIAFDEGSTFNSGLNPVEFTTVNGSVEITNRTPGDADGNGVVNLLDVAYMRRWLAGGWDVTIDEGNADVNGDGIVNLMDVALIKRYLAGGWGVVLR